MKRTKRTVTGLMSEKNRNLMNLFWYRHQPKRICIYCRSRNIALRFLRDAEAEGFTLNNRTGAYEKEYNDIYLLKDNFTVLPAGWADHVMFRNASAGNVIRIDYGKYISGAVNYQM